MDSRKSRIRDRFGQVRASSRKFATHSRIRDAFEDSRKFATGSLRFATDSRKVRAEFASIRDTDRLRAYCSTQAFATDSRRVCTRSHKYARVCAGYNTVP
eukprot:4595563-Prymnesium_polylepis.1